MKALLVAAAFALFATPAGAEQLVSQVSSEEVAITSSFAGETLTLFGSIEPETGSEQRYVEGPYHIIVTVTGPLQRRVARKKTNQFGIWINTQQAQFEEFPSFYQVLSDAKLDTVTNPITLAEKSIPLDSRGIGKTDAPYPSSEIFRTELVRLMQSKGQFKLNEQGVIFRSDTFYFAHVALPSDAPPGPYVAHTYLFKDGQIIAEKSNGFSVRKIGFERFLGLSSRQQPLLYGLVCVALALFTGWLGGVVFKR
ncbi:MAG: hypothetical protein EON57_02890 [Alphaproteobacteria bacterium]|nr:MAG: hypothetical protein EON57_02890 [Alphaproteobacteria bacterium]